MQRMIILLLTVISLSASTKASDENIADEWDVLTPTGAANTQRLLDQEEYPALVWQGACNRITSITTGVTHVASSIIQDSRHLYNVLRTDEESQILIQFLEFIYIASYMTPDDIAQ